MRAKFVRGMTAGAVLGMTAGMLLVPQMNRGTRKRLRRNGRNMIHTVEGVYDTIMDWAR
ncbi:YtxH domain-containing protein [Clostridium sp. MB40-C1]|uniref:YtxH domain-containing protein n=1 Tax=Clostridium sp. MB40-C1 TaxID=3070996 RepID=UPI0027E03D38|nr:YtxH domain-containing protein [Clostridium sp. MB40-C1]WMJ80804.1 YtxH domain-containing protein [Clostridium sp. MB40-C1]